MKKIICKFFNCFDSHAYQLEFEMKFNIKKLIYLFTLIK